MLQLGLGEEGQHTMSLLRLELLNKSLAAVLLLTVFGLPAATIAPSGETPVTQQNAGSASEPEGIPITSELVWEACGSCHQLDDQDRMSRISYMRATPEGWQHKMQRMMSLNGLQLEPDMARGVVKYLSDNLGIAPEEYRASAWESERRMVDYDSPIESLNLTCKQCHSLGRVINQRRTKEEWGLLIAMHRGYYPLVDVVGFRLREPDPESVDNRYRMDRAIDDLAAAFPLETPEWSEWSTNMRDPQLEGTWALSGHHAGQGPVYGSAVITANPDNPSQFVTETTYTYPQSGKSVSRSGRANVYTGFQWRGQSMEENPTQEDWGTDSLKEVMFVERDWQQIWGRWFRGGYDEIGLDISLQQHASDAPIVLGVYPRFVKVSTQGHQVKIYGLNFPASLSAEDLNFGPGVMVSQVVNVASDVVTVELNVSADASTGTRDVFVGRAFNEQSFAVYDQIDAVKVTPQAGTAHVGGGGMFPKGYQLFEAAAYHNGPDGRLGTDDDLRLGPVKATWTLEEYAATFDDDDVQFVGTINSDGMFTPAIDGPNPGRQHLIGSSDIRSDLSANTEARNNIGDVWVVATLTSDIDPEAAGMRGRAHMLVMPPQYRRWFPAEEAGQ